jgi:Polyketide cyclase / dehydrase and lipid transport
MATAHVSFTLPLSADAVWALVSDFGAADRLAPGFIAACSLDESGARIVRFASGMEARERLVGADPVRRRLAYSATGGPAEHHNAVMEIQPEGTGARVIWTTDILPDRFGPIIESLMAQAAAAIIAGCNDG